MARDNVESVDAVVIGAGVVGLAIGRALARAGLETLVLERHGRPGEETSSRNSGVIHSGIYYPTASLKARLCVRGREQLYAYATERGIAHRRCGKLIVAQGSQLAALEDLHRRGVANGVADIEMLDAGAVSRIEPEVRCKAALHSPSTGIIDPAELMTALLGDLEDAGGIFVRNAEFQRASALERGFEVSVRSHGSDTLLTTRRLVNCAGLEAIAVTRSIEGYPPDRVPRAHYAKGSYFACSRRAFSRLVYPMPGEAGLGVHATLDLDGSVRFGPDVQWVARPEYDVDERRSLAFYAAIREYWPGLPDGSLRAAYAGVRPKLVGPGCPASDFVIDGPEQHGLPGLVNLLGIESPGLTAALAIGDHVAGMLETGAVPASDLVT